ncbi:carboxymuconolactone decarboxylase family protein [Polycladidibacter hongkongensis]|uniref:carboxymuconolactone decarboxylase family protein n=1 Tax=Polycladidibacter hongkongensis TaxID=1647556 RepID=UPI000835381E|nr:carboxymuconolactone decarboxylase family protein [Pseudovibrio hongkongensis]
MTTTTSQENTPKPSNRYTRGLAKLREVDGRTGEDVLAGLNDIAPDLARYIAEFAFGDVYSRPGLNLQHREIATIAALAAMGTATPQLKVHIKAGLNVGLSEEQIIEILIQISLYAGFPAAINAVNAARDAFAEHKTL